MTARVVPMPGGKIGVRAPLHDWHDAGRFLHFQNKADADVDLGCQNHREAARVAQYVNGQVEAKARLRAAKIRESENA